MYCNLIEHCEKLNILMRLQLSDLPVVQWWVGTIIDSKIDFSISIFLNIESRRMIVTFDSSFMKEQESSVRGIKI